MGKLLMTKCCQCGLETVKKRHRRLPEGYLCRKCFPEVKQRQWQRFCHNCNQYHETTRPLYLWTSDLNDYFKIPFLACETCRLNKQGWLEKKKWLFADKEILNET